MWRDEKTGVKDMQREEVKKTRKTDKATETHNKATGPSKQAMYLSNLDKRMEVLSASSTI